MDRVSHLVRSRQQQYLSLSHSIGLSLSSRLKFHVKKLFWHFNSLSVNLSFKSISYLFPISIRWIYKFHSKILNNTGPDSWKVKWRKKRTIMNKVSFNVVFMQEWLWSHMCLCVWKRVGEWTNIRIGEAAGECTKMKNRIWLWPFFHFVSNGSTAIAQSIAK